MAKTATGAGRGATRWGRWLRRAALSAAAAALGYAALLLQPAVLFAFDAAGGNVVLHGRSPLPARAGGIAEQARRRVARSPFYDPGATYDVFLCDSAPLFAFFAPRHPRVGGISYWALTGNIFLRPAHVERDRLLGSSGAEVAGERTLTYFVAHEVAHTMVARRIGRLAYARLETWQREGYSDYLAKAGDFDFAANLAAFRAGAAALDPARSGLYLRYHLLVAHLLEHRKMTPEALLAGALDPAPIEDELRGS